MIFSIKNANNNEFLDETDNYTIYYESVGYVDLDIGDLYVGFETYSNIFFKYLIMEKLLLMFQSVSYTHLTLPTTPYV